MQISNYAVTRQKRKACAKAPRNEGAKHGRGIAKRPMWLERQDSRTGLQRVRPERSQGPDHRGFGGNCETLGLLWMS